MKIVQANKYYYPRGGAETYMLSLSGWLEREGNTVIPFAMRHPENLPSSYGAYFVSEVQTNFPPLPKGGLGGVRGGFSPACTPSAA